jgi:HAD superfamily hydrolase (TIGR01509 family)
MNIIILAGGKGSRVSMFDKPKPLINIFDKPIIFYLLDNLKYTQDDNIFIFYNIELDKHNFSDIIKNKYNNIDLITIPIDTKGPCETLYLGLNKIINKYNGKTIVLDCDSFYLDNIIELFKTCKTNMITYRNEEHKEPIYSYLTLDNDNFITDISEKNKISNNINNGCYCFIDINELYNYSKKVLSNYTTKEPYMSCIVSEMLKDNKIFIGKYINNFYSLGTIQEINKYKNLSNVFLFDLDGTLINTDKVYFNIWQDILKSYNIILTHEMYKKYIFGNSDLYVKNVLNLSEDLKILSNLKDELFLKQMQNINLIDGVYDFLHNIKLNGHRISIVTNCNKQIAISVLKHFSLYSIIDYIITPENCEHPKPHSEPYEFAINKYKVSNDKIIIFEDSKTGIQSAKSTFPKCLVGITSTYNKLELNSYGVDISIDNYYHDINIFINYKKEYISKIKKYIINSLPNLFINNIEINNVKLKGGYISEVLKVKIYTELCEYNCVLKLENTLKTNLSDMANTLHLYNREYYFYEHICKFINLNTPKFLGIIKDDNLNNVGILLENLYEKKYTLNLNLNKEEIDVSLNVINNMIKMHVQFWNKDLKKIFPELKYNNDKIFNPTWNNFLFKSWDLFCKKWDKILTQTQLKLGYNILIDFQNIQNRLSNNNLTLIHGDIKSPNIFYDKNYTPYFLDWQYNVIGKGIQDLIFFIIESFDIDIIPKVYKLFINYYYIKINKYIHNYTLEQYTQDIKDSICYFPFFVSVWFGTVPEDELIDKNFPLLFIKKFFMFLELYDNF